MRRGGGIAAAGGAGVNRIVIWLLRLVRAGMVPFASMSSVTPRVCKYEPTCSQYAEQAVRAHGPVRGLAMAGWR
ncbi:MAG: membrane protein insertion efficiency factor YidD, partial [Mycobacteriales bacterium]